MKAGADFEQAGDAAGGGLGDADKNLEQGGFAGAITAYDADAVAGAESRS